MLKLKPEVKEKWLKNLTSGKYSQTTGCLKNEHGHCCLGVLCETKAQMTKKRVWGTSDLYPSNGVPNETVLKWASLDEEAMEKLADFNDNGKSFKWIASYIKRYL